MIEFWGEFALIEGSELQEGVLLTFSSDYKVVAIQTGISQKKASHHHAYCYPNALLTPAFLNMHLHLEYSFAHNLFEPHQGPVSFIQFMRTMDFPSPYTVIQNASHFLNDAYRKGTQFFCDTENHLTLIGFKNLYRHHFLTFYEILGLNNHDFHSSISRIERLPLYHPLFFTPHSFYSVSPELWQGFQEFFKTHKEAYISIHFLESLPERKLLEEKEGTLFDFIQTFANWPFSPQPPTSIVQSHLPTHSPILLVHNTEIRKDEISQLVEQYPSLCFCLCPRSNEYISNQLPPVKDFFEIALDRIMLGTDSLVSNETLHVWDEITFLKKRGISIEYSDIAKMLWLNPTRFLFEQEISLQVGFSPGLVLIQGDWEHFAQTETRLLLPARYPKIPQLSYLWAWEK